MGWEAWTTLGLIAFMVGAMALTQISADVLLWGGVSLLLLLGILEPNDALAIGQGSRVFVTPREIKVFSES